MELCREKILSIFSHIKNVHTFPENKIFHQCEHGPLDKDARLKPWITEGDDIKIYNYICLDLIEKLTRLFNELNNFPQNLLR